jgi:hypothetical protein
MIKEGGYKCIYLPELNPIEEFWSVVKGSVKREFIHRKGTIPQIIAKASHLLKCLHAIRLNILMTTLQATLFNQQLHTMRHFFFEKHDTIFFLDATLFS